MNANRRKHKRIKASVPVELRPESSGTPIHGATFDLSLGGCYIEMIFTLPVGENLEMILQVDGTLLLLATVVTNDPHVGNGIKFTKMLPEDREELQAYLETAEKTPRLNQASERRGAAARRRNTLDNSEANTPEIRRCGGFWSAVLDLASCLYSDQHRIQNCV